jgi:hypothetical protein
MSFYKNDTVRFRDQINAGRMERPLTKEEVKDWYDSPASKGMNCAGETKLCPRGRTKWSTAGQCFTVVRARARNRIGWRSTPGWAVVLDIAGVEWHVKRDSLVKVEV